MELPFGGTFAKDTFETGTRAAAFGGTTTIIDFAVQGKGQALREGLDAWHAKAEGKACVDYGFHMIMSDVTDDTLAEMDTLVDEGVTDFKLFTAYPGVFFSDDGAIFRAMQQTAKNGGLILMHAENGLAIDVVAAQNAEAGNTDPYYHGTSRSPVMEGEATNRVIRLAQVAGVPVYIVHLSAIDALERGAACARRGPAGLCRDLPAVPVPHPRGHGQRLRGCEVHLLAAAASGRSRTGAVEGPRQGRPPGRQHRPLPLRLPRPEGPRQGRLPQGPERPARRRGPRRTCCTDGGVVAGHLTPNRWVEVISAAPARMFGLGGRKGVVAVGADADLVVYDPTREAHDQRDDAPHGRRLLVLRGPRGDRPPDDRAVRGKVIVDGDEWLGAAGDGRFLKREPTGACSPRPERKDGTHCDARAGSAIFLNQGAGTAQSAKRRRDRRAGASWPSTPTCTSRTLATRSRWRRGSAG